jgi:hypothetical protein
MSEYSNETFFEVEQTKTQTSEGLIDLPALYYEASNVFALFRCDPEKVNTLLKDTPYRVGWKLARKPIVVVSFYEYRDTSIGPYNEVALAIPVLRPEDKKPFSSFLDNYRKLSKRKLGYYILDLPVTTNIACQGGIELWGYPKFVTDISFNLVGRNFEGMVKDPNSNEPIVTLSGKIGRGIPAPPFSVLLFSTVGGRDIRTDVNVRGRVKVSRGRGCALSIGDSEHQMAENLRKLDLDGAKPIMMSRTHKFQAILNEGKLI